MTRPWPAAWPPSAPPPRPRPARSRRTAAIVVLAVITSVGSLGSFVAFVAGAFAGDACHPDHGPWVCDSAAAGWLFLLLPALGTAAGITLAAVGCVAADDRASRGLVGTAVAVWLGSGLGWAAMVASL